jgi:arginase
MNETATLETQEIAFNIDRPGVGRRVSILGVPLGFGCSMPGVDIGPAAIRVARLSQRIAQLGYEVRDLGDLRLDCPPGPPNANEKLKFLREITAACEKLCADVKSILSDGELPIVLGGDHSIAVGSVAGVAAHYRERKQQLGLIWFDAHADMNTPETTSSSDTARRS